MPCISFNDQFEHLLFIEIMTYEVFNSQHIKKQEALYSIKTASLLHSYMPIVLVYMHNS